MYLSRVFVEQRAASQPRPQVSVDIHKKNASIIKSCCVRTLLFPYLIWFAVNYFLSNTVTPGARARWSWVKKMNMIEAAKDWVGCLIASEQQKIGKFKTKNSNILWQSMRHATRLLIDMYSRCVFAGIMHPFLS